MSSNLPLRTLRIPALQRQCLFQRRAFSTTAPRPFAATPPRSGRGQNLGRQDKSATRTAARSQSGPAPAVNMDKASQDVSQLAEDIGLLQGTLIRASWRDLPAPWRPGFFGYWWKYVKAWGTAKYSRSAYKRCIYKTKWTRYLPIDNGNHGQLEDKAAKLYRQLYDNFAKGDLKPMTRFLLAPLTKKFNTRIAARGDLKMDWKLHKIHSKKVVSHRAQPLGEDQPDTAYRQIVVRIVSTQQLTLSGGNKNSTASDFTPSASQSPNPRSLRWTPDYPETQTQKQPRQKQNRDRGTVVDNGQQREVVEYMVLQKRVIRGVEEDWKIQGFAEPSTPEKIEEDDEYWRRSLAAQNPEAA